MKELYDHPLTSESQVLEIGGYHGSWAKEIIKRYDCYVTIFEPCFEFFCILKKEFEGNPKVRLFHAGVKNHSGMDVIRWKGDMTGFYADGDGRLEDVVIVPFASLRVHNYDLIQMNAEGSEAYMLSMSCPKMKRLQVQLHPSILGEFVMNKIHRLLSGIHCMEMIYHDEPSHWQIWQRK